MRTLSPHWSGLGYSQGPLGAVDWTGRSRFCGMIEISKLSPLMEPAPRCAYRSSELPQISRQTWQPVMMTKFLNVRGQHCFKMLLAVQDEAAITLHAHARVGFTSEPITMMACRLTSNTIPSIYCFCRVHARPMQSENHGRGVRCTFHGCDRASPGSRDGNEAVDVLVQPVGGLLHDEVQGHQAAQRVPDDGDLPALIAVYRVLHQLSQVVVEANLHKVTGVSAACLLACCHKCSPYSMLDSLLST